MMHLLYLSTNGWVCEKPTLLGHDFLVVDYSGGKMCPHCLRLVVAYNAKVDRYDLTLSLPSEKRQKEETRESDFVNGLIFATVFWIAVILASWAIWFR